MNLRETRKKIKNFWSKKRLSEKDYNYIINLLKRFEGSDSLFFNLNMGKIFLKKGEFSISKHYFLNVLEIDCNNISAHYNMYKVNVYEHNFESAFLELYRYKELLENNNENVNVSFFLSMLEVYLDMKYNFKLYLKTDYLVSESQLYGVVKIYNDDINKCYKELVNCFNNKDFIEMKEIIYQMRNIIDKENYPIEVDTINEILEVIINKQCNKNNLLSYDLNLIQEFLPDVDSNENVSLINFCQLIYKMIDIDGEKAMKFYEDVFKIYNTNDFKLELKNLKNRIIERKQYLEFEPEKRKQYDNFIKNGNISYINNRLEVAVDYYLAGLYVTEHNIFNYYLGKIYYKLYNFEESLKYLEKYKENGGEKLSKCLLYLSKIYKIRKYNKKSKRCEYDILKLKKFYNNHFELNVFNKELDKCLDNKKMIQMKKIKMNCEDFFDNIPIDTDYNECSVKQKLIIIRDLIINNQCQKAEKLLQKLEKTQINMSIEDKKMIKQFQKNKKLYRAKR